MIFCIIFWVFFTLIIIWILICEYAKNGGHHECGIPVVLFCEVWLAAVFCFPLLLILIIWIQRRPRLIISLLFFGFLILYTFIAAWTIWGWYIYFQDENDCQSTGATTGWLVVMCIFMLIGLLYIIGAIVLWTCGCCFYFMIIRQIDD